MRFWKGSQKSAGAEAALLDRVDPLNDRQFEFAIRRLADDLSFGNDLSPFFGSGLEFAHARPYQPGDSIKAIHWRITARTGRPFVKEYDSPKRLAVYLLIDTSASMTLASGNLSKYACALQVAGAIGLTCLRRLNPVGVLGAGERSFRVPPSLSRIQIQQWLHQLRHHRFDEETRLGVRLNELASTLSHRAVCVVLSDLHDPSALSALKSAAVRHEVRVIQLRDPAEDALPTGFVRSREAESRRTHLFGGNGRAGGPQMIREELICAGVDHLLLPVNRPLAPPLRRFLAGEGLGRAAR